LRFISNYEPRMARHLRIERNYQHNTLLIGLEERYYLGLRCSWYQNVRINGCQARNARLLRWCSGLAANFRTCKERAVQI